MKNFYLLLLLLSMPLLVFANGAKESAELNSIVVGTDSTWPPFEFVDTDTGEIIGFTIDLVNAIADEVDLEVTFKTTAWDGIFAGLDIGDYQMVASSVSITEERKKKMTFSDPYFNAGQILAVRSENASGISGLQDMIGKQVGAQIGTVGAEEVSKVSGVELKTYDALGPAVEELANGTIDGIVADTPLVSEYLLKNKKYAGKFTTVGEPMTAEEYGFVFPKTGAEDLVAKINEGLARVKASGKLQEIFSKWME